MTIPGRRSPTRSPPSSAGVRQIQGTLNGIGERCGNANLVTLIPTLMLKPAFADRFETRHLAPSSSAGLTQVARAFDELLNRAPSRQAPYVGTSAFATKAGIHASALAKDFSTYEHVPPESVGNERNIMVSQQAGKSNLLTALERHGIDLAKDDPRLDRLLRDGQGARGRAAIPTTAPTPASSCWPTRCSARCRSSSMSKATAPASNAGTMPRGEQITVTEAVVKIVVDGERLMSVAEGNGPVNALDLALRKDLGKLFRPHRRSRTGRLQGAYSRRRHGRGHPCTGRKPRRHRRALVHHRCQPQHHRRLI